MMQSKCPYSETFDPAERSQQIDPFSWIAPARTEAPVFYSERYKVWVITRHKDIEYILKNPEIFTVEFMFQPMAAIAPEAQAMMENMPPARVALEAPPQDHKRLRKPFTQYFNRRTLAEWEKFIDEKANELVDGFYDEGSIDFVEKFAKRLPAKVIAKMVGIPDNELDRVHRWAEAFVFMINSLDASAEQQVNAAKSIMEFGKYIQEKLETINVDKDEGFMAHLLRYHLEDPAQMSKPELVKALMSSIPAGYQTTMVTFVMGMKTLLEHPGFVSELKKDESLFETSIDEILRYQAGLIFWRRTTKKQVEISGVSIPEGQTLFLHLASAGRDDEIFENPDILMSGRQNAHEHLVFGTGPHRCSGDYLAKMQLAIAYKTLFTRLPNLQPVEGQEYVYEKTLMDRLLRSLHIKWDVVKTHA